jgi:hypothetical protein
MPDSTNNLHSQLCVVFSLSRDLCSKDTMHQARVLPPHKGKQRLNNRESDFRWKRKPCEFLHFWQI